MFKMHLRSAMLTIIIMFLFLAGLIAGTGASPVIRLSVLEEQPPRTLVGKLRELIKLDDTVPNKEDVFFVFKHANRMPYSLFSIIHSSGHLVTTRTLNRENLCHKVSHSQSPFSGDECFFQLEIQVKPSKSAAASFVAKVQVELVDINDYTPTFTQTVYSLEVNENSPIGSLFKIPLAIDYDAGMNSIQDYRLPMSTDADFPFALIYANNDLDYEMELNLKLISPLDREAVSGYRTIVTAVDGGEPPKSGSMTVDIKISDSNDNRPTFDSVTYSVDVSENLGVGTTIMRVYAEDADVGLNGEVVYKLVDSSMALFGDIFRIEKESGSIVLRKSLDYESVKSYLMVVEASDLGTVQSAPSFARVFINVVDENDNYPQIAVNSMDVSSRYEIEENAPANTFIAYLSVSDADDGKNGQVTCSISKVTALDGDSFDEDEDGDDSEDTGSYFNDEVDDQITTLNGSREHVRQRRTSNSKSRLNNNLNAEVISWFRLEKVFNSEYKLENTRSLDRELVSHYRVAVECSDQGSEPKSSWVTIKVKVLDKNDNAPEFDEKHIELQVSETVQVGTLLATISASDRDEGANSLVHYLLEPLAFSDLVTNSDGSTDSAIRTINQTKTNTEANISKYVKLEKNTGHLFAIMAFDYETMPTDLRFKVTAHDHGTPRLSSWVPLTIFVNDRDDEKPVFDQPSYTFTISESDVSGHLVGHVTAVDADVASDFNKVVYTLVPSFDATAFKIDPKSGTIRTSSRVDREIKDLYNFAVLASNPSDTAGSGLSAIVNVSVHVQDSNDNQPIFIFPEKFRLSRIAVPLNAERGSAITKLVATDKDTGENALLTFSIVSVEDYNDGRETSGMFTVDGTSGDVTNLVALEAEKTYRLRFLAEDGGNPPLSSTVELLVSVNGSLSTKGAALRSDKALASGVDDDRLMWFGLEHRYFLPMLLAVCCGAIGVLALVLAITVFIMCRRKRTNERKEKKKIEMRRSESFLNKRDRTGSYSCGNTSCEETGNYRWPEGAEEGGGDNWKKVSRVPSLSSKRSCSSDKHLPFARRETDVKNTKSDGSSNRRCPGVGRCESDRGGSCTDCECCKDGLLTVAEDGFCRKARSCCQVNQKKPKPDLSSSGHLYPPTHAHCHHHRQHQGQSNHQLPPATQHHYPVHPELQTCYQSDCGQVRGKRKAPGTRPRRKVTQFPTGKVEGGDASSGSDVKLNSFGVAAKIVPRGDYSESDMSGSCYYGDSGLDSDQIQPATHSS